MKRRGFLKALAAAPVAAPAIAAEAVAGGGVAGMSGAGVVSMSLGGVAENSISSVDWAKRALTKMVGMSSAQLNHDRLSFIPDGIDPDLFGMRSLSQATKVRWSHDRQFYRHIQYRKNNLLGIIAGWDDQ